MIFHSLDFVAFFLVTVTLYWRLPHRGQNLLLLAASYVFYGWVTPWFLILLVTSTTIDWWAALRMEADPAHRKRYLAFSIASNMGMLAYFKYANFFIDNVAAALTALGLETSPRTLSVVLPVGISFFTFQALSYTVDVYRGQLRARRSLVDVATFVAFFPQLVAGPIERAAHLLPEVEGERRFSADAARSGLVLMAWGFFKKLVVADNAGVIADKVFALEAPAFEILWAGVFAFAIQIYADFSAYSDIARGTARWFGFELMVNFDHPYLAQSPQDFWRRWHISLSTWFRDYVYIPLGGSKMGFGRELAAIMATFLLSGFWHGASWNYVLWGGYHGLLLVLSRIRRRILGPTFALRATAGRPARALAGLLAPLRVAGMFVLVCIGWLMFRETNLAMLVRDLTLTPAGSSHAEHDAGIALLLRVLPYAAPLLVQSLWVEFWRARGEEPTRPVVVDGLIVGLLFSATLVFRSRASLDFIYFQF